MTARPDIHILELMASKICHDLISPVGAMANGVEILEELGPDSGEDVIGLIAFSAEQASAKLRSLRLAYGLGGSDSSILPKDVHTIFGDFIKGDNRIKQDWDPRAPLGPTEPLTGFSKILMSLLLLTCEALPKGGVISVQGGGPNLTLITGTGENAGFRDGYLYALQNKTQSQDLEPKFVHAYITGLLAGHYGFSIEVDPPANNIICLRLKSPDVS